MFKICKPCRLCIPSFNRTRKDLHEGCSQNYTNAIRDKRHTWVYITCPSMTDKLATKLQTMLYTPALDTSVMKSIQISSAEQQYVFVFRRQKLQQCRAHQHRYRRCRSLDHHPCAPLPCCQAAAHGAVAQWRSSRTCVAQQDQALQSAQLFIQQQSTSQFSEYIFLQCDSLWSYPSTSTNKAVPAAAVCSYQWQTNLKSRLQISNCLRFSLQADIVHLTNLAIFLSLFLRFNFFIFSVCD